ncbi:MAG TPA: hypothetical protein VLV31_04225 [Candidatus Acidoferrales bacterium]|nr:hypothetical protein [Candidatus Acidoferrales bacterium]
MNTRLYAMVVLGLSVTLLATGLSMRPALADSCTAQLTYPVMPVNYNYSTLPIVIPITVTCDTYYGSQLYATANLYDLTAQNSLGSISALLPSTNGGTIFSGQFGFNLSPSTQGDTAQTSVSVYDNQYGNLITTTSLVFQVLNGAPQVSTTTVTQTAAAYPYPYQYPSPNQSPSQYPSQYPLQNQPQSSPQTHHHHYQLWGQNQSSNNPTMLTYVAIAAILAVVLIATAGLVVYATRRRPYWVPALPPPPPPPSR